MKKNKTERSITPSRKRKTAIVLTGMSIGEIYFTNNDLLRKKWLDHANLISAKYDFTFSWKSFPPTENPSHDGYLRHCQETMEAASSELTRTSQDRASFLLGLMLTLSRHVLPLNPQEHLEDYLETIRSLINDSKYMGMNKKIEVTVKEMARGQDAAVKASESLFQELVKSLQ